VIKFGFYYSKLRKQPFAEFLKFPPSFRQPCSCIGEVRATPLKNWGNYKRFNTILNIEILLNGKMRYLTDKFQLCFCFCIGNAK